MKLVVEKLFRWSNFAPVLKNKYSIYRGHPKNSNNEWNFTGYSYEVTDVVASNSGLEYSTLNMTLKLERFTNYYEMTLFIPVVIMAVMSTVGLMLPDWMSKNPIFTVAFKIETF